MSERRRVSSGSPFEPTIGFSRALRVGDRVWVSGTGPVWVDGTCPDDAGTQTRRCFDIILAALRLILKRIEERLQRRQGQGDADLLAVLSEALALDRQRFIECAFWMAFWGQVSADKTLRRLNAWVHREYMRLFDRCFATHWPRSAHWPSGMWSWP